MMSKDSLVRLVLAFCVAVAGVAFFLACLGGESAEVRAAAAAAPPVASVAAPAAEGTGRAVMAPRQANGIGASPVVTVCKPSAGTCDYPSPQAAAAAVVEGTIIKVAEGVYTDTDGDGYVLFITRTVTLEGGYAVGDWTAPDPAARPTVLDGENARQVIYVAMGTAPVVGGFHIRNGNASQTGRTNGGGVYIASGAGNLVLQDNRIYGNAALNYGGGIYISSGAPIVRRNRIYANSAGNRGGGIYVAGGEPVVENNLIYTNTTPSHGGGIYLSSGAGKVWYNVLYDNRANAGGGIYISSGSAAGITACAVISNVAGSGGGFFGIGVSISPQYNNVWGNIGGNYNAGFPIGLNDISADPRFVNRFGADFRLAPDSPCIGSGAPGAYPADDFDQYARPFGPRADIGAYEFYTGTCFARVGSGQIYTTVHAAVADNYPNNVVVKVAGYCAGVSRVGSLSQTVYINYNLTLRGGYTITNWEEADWHAYTTTLDAQGQGRVIYIKDAVAATVEGFDIRGGNWAAANYFLGGGGIFVGDGDSVIRYNRIYSNTVHNAQGGGIALRGGAPAVYENEIYANTAAGTGVGGGVGVNSPGGSPLIERNRIHHNHVANASVEGGGGIGSTVSGGYTLTVRNNVIYSNTAPRGGGISAGGGFALVEDNQIYDNVVLYVGGGVYVRAGASGLVENNTVYGNRVTTPGGSEGGGGIYIFGSSTNLVTVRGNTIHHNRVEGPRTDVFGGGIYAQIGWPSTARITIEANRVYTNSAYHGAGITAFPDDGEAYVRNNLLYDNRATGNGGGLMAWKGGAGDLVVENNTLYRNGAVNGGGIFQQTSTPIIRSNIIANSVSGGGIANDGNATAPCNYCDIYNNTGGNSGGGVGSISADPQFVDAAAGDFHLQAGSPCINAADPVNYPSDDVESYARPFGARADIGAHEYYTGHCFARLLTNGWVYSTVQAAVISATTSGAPLPEVRVAGYCEGSVVISRSLTLRGGYSPTHWTSPVTPTTLVASAGQRVIYLTGTHTSTITIGELILTGGSAAGNGGGIYVAAPLSPTIENVIFHHNTASGNGGAFASVGGNPRLYHNTVAFNSSGLYFAAGRPVISSTIVVSNTGAGIAAAGGVMAALAYNDVWGNGVNYTGLTAGVTDIGENPRFVNAAGGNFRLQPGSACINTADPHTALTVDFEGDARPTPATQSADIGADEATAYIGVTLGPDRYAFADPGQVIRYTHYITNTGTEQETYDLAHTAVLSGSGNVNDWGVTYTPVYTLAPGGVAAVQVEVSVPISATSDSLLTVYMTATARTNPAYFFDTAQAVLDVSREFRVEIGPAYNQSANPGTVLVYFHAITNTGNGPDTFRLALGSSLGWAAMNPPAGSDISLGSGLSAQVRVTVTIPNFAAGGALETTVVTATSLGSGGTVADNVVNMTQANSMIGTRYVSPAGNDKPDGRTLNSCRLSTIPCRTIKQALDQAASDDVIKVAGGVYQEYNVTINKLVELQGGYNNAFSVRDWEANVTTIDAQRQGRVLYIFGNALVEGFTLQNGQFNGPGGGVYVVGSPILRHTVITNNVSLGANNGGGIYNANGDVTLEWSTVVSNTAGLNGGGFYNARGNPVVRYNVFERNVAINGRGGGFYNTGAFAAAPRIWSNVFYGNRAGLEGGGLYNLAGDAQVLHNTFVANENDAISIAGGTPTIQNSIVVSNTGRGIYSAVALTPDYNDVWQNSGGNYGGSASAGVHSISADPLFRDAPVGDFRLRDGSPCIEAGTAPLPPALQYDLEGQPRTMGNWPDMGADEFQKIDVEWLPATSAQDGWPYQPMTYTHQLHNLGNYTDTFEVMWSNEWPGWDVTVNGSSVQPVLLTLGKNATTTVHIRMAPTNLFSGTTNTTVVTATSQIALANPEVYAPISATLVDTTTVRRAWYVALEPDRIGWGPATAYDVVYVHTVTNTGNYTDSFTFSWINDLVPPGCAWPVYVSPANSGPLGQGMTATVIVTVTVPPCANVGTGIYANTAIITATSDSNGSTRDNVTDITVSNWQHGVAFAANQSANGNTGTKVRYSHVLTNTGNYTDTFALQAVSSRGWNVVVAPQPHVTIGPGLTTTVEVTVTIPVLGVAFGGDVDHTVVTVRSTTAPTWTAAVTDTTTVNRTTGALFVYNYDGSDFPAVRVENTPPGSPKEVVFVHTLTNVGNAPDTFDLTINGSQPWALAISPSPTVTLGWQEKITVVITVTVPALPIVVPSPVDTIVARAASQAYPASSDVVTDVVILNQVPGVNLSADQALVGYPGLQTAGWVTYTHRLTNTGSYTDSFELTFRGWAVEFPAYPTRIIPNVPPGGGVTFQARVRVPFEPCGTVGVTVITATSVYSDVYADRLVDTTTIGAVYGVDIDNVGVVRALADGSGGIANYTHKLTSLGNCDGVFTLAGVQVDPNLAPAVAPPTVTLDYYTERNVQVTVNITPTLVGLWGNVVITAAGPGGSGDRVTDTIVVNQEVGVSFAPDLTRTVYAAGAISYTHILTNEGNYTDTFSLTGRNEHGWNVSVQPATASGLGPGASRPVTVWVTPPANVYTITSRTFVTATSAVPSGEPVRVYSPTASVVDTTIVRRPHAVILPEPGYNLSLDPGVTRTLYHTLTNDGGLTGTYQITYFVSSPWIALSSALVNNLPPGGQYPFTVSVQIPPASWNQGAYAVITATDLLSGVQALARDTITVPKRFDVNFFPAGVAHVQPPAVVTFYHTLENTGNYTTTYDLLIDGEFSDVSITPARVENLRWGETVPVTVVIRVPYRAAAGDVEDTRITIAFANRSVDFFDRVYISHTIGTRYVDINGWDEENNCRESNAPCRTVQYAVDQASHGDEIHVAAGTYRGGLGASQVVNVNKSVALIGGYNVNNWAAGSDPVNNLTVLDAENRLGRRVVVVTADITPTIAGFHLRGGYVNGNGAGLYIESGAVPTVRSCVIYRNTAIGASAAGAGIYYGGGGMPLFERNKIYENQAAGDGRGGGIYLAGGGARVWNNLVYYNTAAFGGGLYNAAGTPAVWNNTFYANTAGDDTGGGGLYSQGGTLVLSNTIVAENTGTGIRVAGGSAPLLAYNDVWGNSPINYDCAGCAHPTDISADPQFLNKAAADLHLTSASPCVNAGQPGVSLPANDYEGNARPIGGRYDIGAYEYGLGGSKMANPIAANPGTQIVYRILLANATTSPQYNIPITDTLHKYLAYVPGSLQYTAGVGRYITATRTISWVGSVEPLGSVFITFTTDITGWLGSDVVITNVAWINYAPEVAATAILPVPNTRYVAPDGDDVDNGCNFAWRPCKTVQRAVNQALPGDEIKVATGVYTGSTPLVSVAKSITLTGGFTWTRSYTSPVWTYAPELYPTILRGGVAINGPVAVGVDGFHIVGGQDGVYVAGGADLFLHRSWVYDNARDGVRVEGGSTCRLVNNVVARNAQMGVRLTASRGVLIHNTLARQVNTNMFGLVVDGSAVLTNTIFYQNARGLRVTAGSTATLEATLWSGNGANQILGTLNAGTISLTGNPSFADPINMDYHLNGDSAAIDAGIDAGVTSDIDRDERPVLNGFDIGADEYPLRIVKVGPATAIAGQTITYVVSLQAKDPGLIITDVLPMHLTFTPGVDVVTCTVGTCGYLTAQSAITWTGDTRATGEVVITYTGSLTTWLAAGTVIPNTATMNRAGYIKQSPVWNTTITAVPGVRYVAPSGVDRDPDTGTYNNCLVDWKPCATLQYAVDQAQAGDVIKVATGVYTDIHTVGGTTQIVRVGKNLTIRGGYTVTNWLDSFPELQPTLLDANGLGRVLYVAGPVTVTVDGLHLLRGAGLADGGNVYVTGAALTLAHSRVYSGVVLGSGREGGGIYADSAALTLEDSRVYANRAGNSAGGGIYYTGGTLLLNRASIYRNEAASSSGHGGGVAGSGGLFRAVSSNIYNNTAGGYGGGLYLSNVSVAVTDSQAYANLSALGGGGFYMVNSDVTLTGNRIYTNTANSSGGGVMMYLCPRALLDANVIMDNAGGTQSNMYGGGVYLFGNNTTFTMTNNIVAVNRVGGGGDGIYLASNFGTTNNASLYHNTIADNDGDGLRVDAFGFTVSLQNSILVGHQKAIVTTWSTAFVTGQYVMAYGNIQFQDNSGGGVIFIAPLYTTEDPLFRDRPGRDYHIRFGSPAVDRCPGVGVLHDIDGDTRPQAVTYDIGADELNIEVRAGKYADPDPVEAGAAVTYTIYVTNTGGVDVHATITDTLPAQLTTSGPLTWSSVFIGYGQVWSTTVVADVAWGYTGTLTNVVRVTTQEGASDIYTATSRARVTPALAVAKYANPDPVEAGAAVTYTIYLTNTGNVTLTVTLTDVLPAQLTPAPPVTWTATVGEAEPVWTTTLRAVAAWNYSGTLTNTLLATSDWGASALYTMTSQARVTPAFAVDKRAALDLVEAGGRLTYTIRLTNTGNVDLLARLTDTLPAQVTTTQPLTWTALITAPGGLWEATLGVTVAEGYDGPIVNRLDVAASPAITAWAGVEVTTTAFETTTVKGPPSLSIAKTASPSAGVLPGGLLVYRLLVANGGPGVATTPLVTDALPANTTFQSCSGGNACGYSGGVVTWTLDTLAAGAQSPVTFTVQVGTGVLSGTAIVNQNYGVTCSEGLSAGGAPVSVLVGLSGGVAVSAGRAQTVLPGNSIVYTHRVTNTANSPQTVDVTYHSSRGWAQVAPTTLTSLAANGGAATVRVTVTVPFGAPTGAEDTTTITVTGRLRGQATASDRTTVGCAGVFNAAFTFAPTAPKAGQTVALTGTVGLTSSLPLNYTWNFGDSTAPMVQSGVMATTSSVTHTFALEGVYTVALTVTNSCGQSVATPQRIEVSSAGYAIYLPLVLRNW